MIQIISFIDIHHKMKWCKSIKITNQITNFLRSKQGNVTTSKREYRRLAGGHGTNFINERQEPFAKRLQSHAHTGMVAFYFFFHKHKQIINEKAKSAKEKNISNDRNRIFFVPVPRPLQIMNFLVFKNRYWKNEKARAQTGNDTDTEIISKWAGVRLFNIMSLIEKQ